MNHYSSGGVDSNFLAKHAGDLCAGMAARTPAQRRVLWWLHSLFVEDGEPAFKAAVGEVVKLNPDRLATALMLEHQPGPGGVYDNEIAGSILRSVGDCPDQEKLPADFDLGDNGYCDYEAAQRAQPFLPIPKERRTEAFLRGRCLVAAKGLPRMVYERLCRGDIPNPVYFQGLDVALADYERQQGAAVKAGIYMTNVGQVVWDTLEVCIAERVSGIITGREGRGKTENAKACVRAHRGEARFWSVPGNSNQTNIFRSLGNALDLPHRSESSASILSWRIADYLKQSGLVLVIDEAQFLLMGRGRSVHRNLMDWLHGDLMNEGVPVVLLAEPKFGASLQRLADTSGWNLDQFKRRFERWRNLPESTDRVHLLAIAERAMPQVGAHWIRKAVDYQIAVGRDVSGLGDFISEARRQARLAGHADVLPADAKAAAWERAQNDNAMALVWGAADANSAPTSRPSQPAAGASQDGDSPSSSASQPRACGDSAAVLPDQRNLSADSFPGGDRLTTTPRIKFPEPALAE